MTDNLLCGYEARQKIVAGANKVADAVKGTLGAAGYNALLEHTLPPYAITTNDGVSIAKSIYLADPYENLGASLMKEIASKADKVSNDGTTTAITLAQAIIQEGMKVKVSPMQLKRSLESCIGLVETALEVQSRAIGIEEIGTVATISAEDHTIGSLIQEIYSHIGKDGIIFNDASRDYKDSYTLDRGVHIMDCGMSSPFMADMSQEGQLLSTAEIKNPAIILTRQKINSVKDLESIGTILAAAGKKELVIFADEFEGTVVNDLVLTRVKGGIRTLLVKLPILWQDWWLEDIAKLTGATLVDPAQGLFLKDFKASMLGTCGSILTDKENTFLDGTLDVMDHVQSLMEKGDDDSKLRAARLNKRTAKYHVGALSEQALKYRKDKVVDALGTAYQALHGGIVAGGGIPFVNCSRMLAELDTVGAKILKKALVAPFHQIVNNAGYTFRAQDVGEARGFDAKNGILVDMFDAGIVDAYSTVLNSFKAAISVASTILTAHVVTLLPKQEQLNPFNPYERTLNN